TSFIRHPQTGERLYTTGDIGRYLPDGTVEFLGREDSQVKIAGRRIELGEIEATLLAHPGVSKAVVTAIGERFENKQLIAYVVPTPDVSPSTCGETQSMASAVPIASAIPSAHWKTLVNNCWTRRLALSEPMVDDTFLEVWQTLERISLHI